MKWMTLLVLSIIIAFTGCSKSYKVIEIVDGDTFIVKPKLYIRIIGIDAPENDVESQKFKEDMERYESSQEQELKLASDSKLALQKLLLNKKVTLKSHDFFDYEILENGRTGRALRFVYFSNEDIGKTMLQKGYARTWNNTGNLQSYRHQKEEEYSNDEINAKISGAGIWQNLGSEKK